MHGLTGQSWNNGIMGSTYIYNVEHGHFGRIARNNGIMGSTM